MTASTHGRRREKPVAAHAFSSDSTEPFTNPVRRVSPSAVNRAACRDVCRSVVALESSDDEPKLSLKYPGVAMSTASNIINRKTWASAPEATP